MAGMAYMDLEMNYYTLRGTNAELQDSFLIKGERLPIQDLEMSTAETDKHFKELTQKACFKLGAKRSREFYQEHYRVMILRWTFLSFSLFSLLGFLLQVQAKENAALMLPSFQRISKQDQQILILNLEQELSTRFNLLSKEVVNESFRKAIASLLETSVQRITVF